MKRIILGTAGHIDHGKTALIKALSGVDCDRLKEEKRRGITIELGFTSIALPSGQRLGIVDVPGHERFVDHMVAGATGIDMVLMVIAADEGVMPQTREHLDICKLLGIRTGLVALTKVDLADEEIMELVGEEVAEFVEGSFLQDCPVVPFSSMTGQGREALIDALESVASGVRERGAGGIFRMPIDRVFTMKGFGSVVTGTPVDGAIDQGESAEILPDRIATKVRGIQVHEEKVDRAEAGQRTALNLAGLEKSALHRGSVVAHAGRLKPTVRLDTHYLHLPTAKRPLRNRFRATFHIGTARVLGRVILYNADEIAPGSEAFVQFRIEEPVVAMCRDRFIVRDFSTNDTIGGGEVLDASPYPARRFDAAVLGNLEKLHSGELHEACLAQVRKERMAGVSARELEVLCRSAPEKVGGALKRLEGEGAVVRFEEEEGRVAASEYYVALRTHLLDRIRDYHARNPLKEGIAREEMKGKLPVRTAEKFFGYVLGRLEQEGEIVSRNDLFRLAGREITLGDDEQRARERILRALRAKGLTPPTFKEMVESVGLNADRLKTLIEFLVGEGEIVKVSESLFYHPEPYGKLRESLIGFLEAHGEISIQQYRELANLSRKFLVPLAEHFDNVRLTIRVGDKRHLLGGSK